MSGVTNKMKMVIGTRSDACAGGGGWLIVFEWSVVSSVFCSGSRTRG